MPRRNLVPLALLAVLVVLTAGFAVLGLSAAPPTGSVIVQNATAQSLGTPTGSTGFSLELTTTVSTGSGATGSAVHLVDYRPPDRMTVYQVTPRLTLLGQIPASSISCVVNSYSAITAGTTPWKATGSAYSRTESLADFSARVPNGNTCAPQPSAAHGHVLEKAVVRSGYLIALRTTVVIPPQTLLGGAPATSGTQSETLVFLQINGTATRKLIS